MSLSIALAAGLLWMALVHCLPNFISNFAVVIGSLTLIVGAIVLFIDNGSGW
jgi:hypothetical protein